jgi:prohibitin 1
MIMSNIASTTDEEQHLLFPAYLGRRRLNVRPEYRVIYTLISVISLIFLVSFLAECTFVVPPGEVAVVVTLGHGVSRLPGFHLRYPFISELKFFSAKIQKSEAKNIVPTKEGLAVTLDTVILFRINPKKVLNVFQTVGVDYVEKLIEPEAASAVRGLTSESEAKALYSSGRSMIQDTVKAALEMKLIPRGIIIEEVLLKDIHLPDELNKSIESKVQAEQEAARMYFVLQKEEQEAQRKTIEAKGIAAFQRIVSEGISPQLLAWKGIEATREFATSPNTKVVIVGNGANDLPVILSASDDETANTVDREKSVAGDPSN